MPVLDAAQRADVREGGIWTPRQRVKNALVYAAIRAGLAFAGLLPARLLGLVCRGLGLVAYAVLGRERQAVRERLGAGLGAPPPEARVRRAFAEAGGVLADTLALLDPDEAAGRTMRLDDASREVFRAALDEGRGVVFVSAHLGSWERMAAVLAADGFPVWTVARESYDPRLTRLYERLRAPRGVRSIYRGSPAAARAIFRALSSGEAVGFLIDLPGRAARVGCRLYGADRDVALGAAQVALARGAPLLVGTPMPRLPGRGREPGRAEVQVTRIPTRGMTPAPLTQRLAAELDLRIAAGPEAWLGLFSSAVTLPALGDPR